MSVQLHDDLDLTWGDDDEGADTERDYNPVPAPRGLLATVKRTASGCGLMALVVILAAALLASVIHSAALREERDILYQSRDMRRAHIESLTAEYAAVVVDRAVLASATADLQSQITSLTTALEAVERERDAIEEDLEQLKQQSRTTAAPSSSRSTAPRTTPDRRDYTTEEVKALIRTYFPADAVAEALYIAQRESGYDDLNATGDCWGVFQLASCHGGSERLDAVWNVRTAARLYVQSGNSFERHWYDHAHYPRFGG